MIGRPARGIYNVETHSDDGPDVHYGREAHSDDDEFENFPPWNTQHTRFTSFTRIFCLTLSAVNYDSSAGQTDVRA